MRRTVLVAGLLAVALAGLTSVACATEAEAPWDPRTNRADPQPARQPIEFKEAWIALRRTECYGTCPVFDLSVFDDGSVIYHGQRFVMRRGLQKGTLSSATMAELRRALEASNVKALDPNCCNCRTRTDFPWTHVTIFDATGGKSVDHYHGCKTVPASLATFEETVIRLTGALAWIGTDAERARQKWKRDSR